MSDGKYVQISAEATKEPWEILHSKDLDTIAVSHEGRTPVPLAIMQRDRTDTDTRLSNANRIVSCVNSCSWVEDPEIFLQASRDLFMEVSSKVSRETDAHLIEILDTMRAQIRKKAPDGKGA